MKTQQFKYVPIALAVAALFSSSLAFSQDDEDGGRNQHNFYADVKINARADLSLDKSTYENKVKVSVDKTVKMKREVNITGGARVSGTIPVNASSAALVNQQQDNDHNAVNNNIVDNNAKVDGNVLNHASGNIGVNVTSGDNNFQDNSAALSAVDAAFVFADAESISNQNAEMNHTVNLATRNNASLSGNALSNATGNIGVNIASGDSNLQANSMSASVNKSGTMAEANVTSRQLGDHNQTANTGANFTIYDRTNVTLTGKLSGGSIGVGFGGYEGTNSGGTTQASTSGTSVQNNNWYPDIWSSSQQHPCSNCFQTGHVDLDGSSQGARLNGKSDENGPIGGLGLDNTGTSTGTYSGSTSSGNLAFVEYSAIGLSGTFTGVVDHTYTAYRPHENNASIGGNALQNATGNIGVNIAAGTNNLQGNHLAIAAALGDGTVRPGGGE